MLMIKNNNVTFHTNLKHESIIITKENSKFPLLKVKYSKYMKFTEKSEYYDNYKIKSYNSYQKYLNEDRMNVSILRYDEDSVIKFKSIKTKIGNHFYSETWLFNYYDIKNMLNLWLKKVAHAGDLIKHLMYNISSIYIEENSRSCTKLYVKKMNNTNTAIFTQKNGKCSLKIGDCKITGTSLVLHLRRNKLTYSFEDNTIKYSNHAEVVFCNDLILNAPLNYKDFITVNMVLPKFYKDIFSQKMTNFKVKSKNKNNNINYCTFFVE